MKAYAKTLLVSIVLLLCAQIAAQTNIDLVCNSMYSWQSWTNIATKDDQAYAVGTGPSMYLLDLSDSNHPQYNGVFNTPGTYAVKDIEIVGNTTILFQDGRVHWVDISIPNYPELTASVSFTGQYSWKAISESHAYVINRQGELYCYNFADPFTPVLTDSLYLGGTSNYAKIGILGNRAYVSGLGNWIVLDISDPHNISIIGTVPDTENCYIPAFGNGAIYGVYGGRNLKIYTPDNNGILTVSSSYTVWSSDYISQVRCGEGFVVLTHVESPQGQTDTSYYYTFLGVTNPVAPTVLRQGTYNGGSIALSGNRFFMTYSYKLSIYQTTPGGTGMVFTGMYSQGQLRKIALNDTHAFVADNRGNVKVYDDLLQLYPNEISEVWVNGLSDIAITDDLLFATATYLNADGFPQGPKLRVFDISNPASLIQKYVYTFESGTYNSMSIDGQTACFAVNGKLIIGDISSPDSFTQLSVINDQNISYVKLSGTHAFCIGYFNGSPQLAIYDISDPTDPQMLSALNMPGPVLAMGIRGSYAYLGGEYSNITTVNISNPANPIIIGSQAFAPTVYNIEPGTGYIAVHSSGGLRIFNTEDNANLELVGSYDMNSPMRSMAILGNHAFVAQNSCLGVYDFSAALALCSETPQESVPELLRISVQPNPFNTSTAIVLKLPRQSYAQSSIYNIKGQKVYQITERSLPSGVNTLYWDGRSENGKVLPNGIYLLRVSVKGKHFVSRLTLLK